MLTPSEATIYISGQRGCTQSSSHRSLHTLNFGNYHREHRKPFQWLRAFNDETLAAAASIQYEAQEDTMLFLMPVVGGVAYEIENVISAFVDVGESIVIPLPRQSKIKLSNPYQEEPINFMQAWFTPMLVLSSIDTRCEFSLKLNDQFQELFSSSKINIRLMRCTGRRDQFFQAGPACTGLFAFVLEGAFEFNNRLLEARDSLALHNTAAAEFEALSQDAMVLLFEFYP
jgi:hypothetical protein